MKANSLVRWFIGGALLVCGIVGLAIVLGGPATPAPMPSINDPFSGVDFSNLPRPNRYIARDKAPLAYRQYPSSTRPAIGSVVLIHGSSASSHSMHPMAKTMAEAGFDVYALDMRGHGDSGVKGRISYIGQLEDDIEDFLTSVNPAGKRTLVGFSSGGGFALRFAASPRQKLFDNYLLLSPFLHQDAPTYRPNGGGWASVGIPRIVAISLLNQAGVTAFNSLPVVEFALGEKAKTLLTPSYSYGLAANFRPHNDYRRDIQSAMQPIKVLVGANDEIFRAEAFAAVFSDAGKPVDVTILPSITHIPMTLNQTALQEAVAAIKQLDRDHADTGR